LGGGAERAKRQRGPVENATGARAVGGSHARERGTQAAERAELLAAEAFFRERNFSQAQQQFAKYRADHPDSALTASAAYGVAASLDAQGKLPEAIAAYQEVTTRYATSSVAPQAKLALARAQDAANKPDLALKIYDEMANPANFTAFSTEANDLREQLLAKHPELKPASTLIKPVSVTTNAAGQRITLTPVASTNGAKGSTNKGPTIKLNSTPPPAANSTPATPPKK
jgi:tetratricopeptide (TPR) repeat protein